MRRSSITSALLTVVGVLSAPGASPLGQPLDADRAGDKQQVRSVDQMPGFPIVLPVESFHEMLWNMRGLVLADLDGDGASEVVYTYQTNFPNKAEEGHIVVWDHTGQIRPGFPMTTAGGAFFTPSVGDLDGDGDLEIVQVTIDLANTSRLYAVDHHGQVLPGFPVRAGSASVADGATLYDLDDDGRLEIIYASSLAAHVFDAEGREWDGGWPAILFGSSEGTPAIGDVDDDGAPEIFITDNNFMHLFRIDGSELPGWPRSIAGAQFSILSSAALADLDHDLDLEIIVPAWFGDVAQSTTTEIHVFHHDGAPVTGWPQTEALARTDCSPVVTDLEGDGEVEILIGSQREIEHVAEDGTIRLTRHAQISAWDAYGRPKPGFPWLGEDGSNGIDMLTTADMDGDGRMEIFSDSWGRSDYQGYLFGIDSTGALLPGFPLRPRGETWPNGAVLDDVDRDGDLELASVSFSDEAGNMSVSINLYDLAGAARRYARDWPTFHKRNHRGGLVSKRYRGWRVVYADRSNNPPTSKD